VKRPALALALLLAAPAVGAGSGATTPQEPPHAVAAPGAPGDGGSRLSADPSRVAAGLFLDSPVSGATIDHSLRVLEGLRCRYGLRGGVRDDEEAGRRALAELDARELTPEEVTREAERLGIDLDPAACGDACENLENLVRLRLRQAALERLADVKDCLDARSTPPVPAAGDDPPTARARAEVDPGEPAGGGAPPR